jgi:hypothetical protein
MLIIDVFSLVITGTASLAVACRGLNYWPVQRWTRLEGVVNFNEAVYMKIITSIA